MCPANSTPDRLYWTRSQTADAFGITTKTLDRLIARGEIRVVKIGTAVRIHQDELEAFRARGGSSRPTTS